MKPNQTKPYQLLPLRARVDLVALVIRGYSAFLETPALLDLTIRLFSVLSRTLVWRESFSSSEKQWANSTAPADCARRHWGKLVNSWLHCFYQIKTTRRTLLYWHSFTPLKPQTQYFLIGLALGINCQNTWGWSERLRYRSRPFHRQTLLRLSIRNQFKVR